MNIRKKTLCNSVATHLDGNCITVKNIIQLLLFSFLFKIQKLVKNNAVSLNSAFKKCFNYLDSSILQNFHLLCVKTEH